MIQIAFEIYAVVSLVIGIILTTWDVIKDETHDHPPIVIIIAAISATIMYAALWPIRLFNYLKG